jgi:hypothetical protein
MGGGWNLFGWWPGDAGFDVSGSKFVRFAIRVVASGSNAPEPLTLSFSLGCSGRKPKCASSSVLVAEYAKGDLFDGGWHEVHAPLDKLSQNETFDAKSVWELDWSTWSESEKNFDLYIDDIAFVRD